MARKSAYLASASLSNWTGFNVTYLLDALMAIDTEQVSLELIDANSSCLVSAPDSDVNRHVVMPLKL